MAKHPSEVVYKENKSIDFEDGKTLSYEYSYEEEDQLGAKRDVSVIVRRSLVPFRYGNRKVNVVENYLDDDGTYLRESAVEADRTYLEEQQALENVLSKFNTWEGVHTIDRDRKYTTIDRDTFKTDYLQLNDLRRKMTDVFNSRFIKYARGRFLDVIAEGLNSRVRRLPGESDESFRVRLKYSTVSQGDPTVAGIEAFIYSFFGHHLGKDLKEVFVVDEQHTVTNGKVQTTKNHIYVDGEVVRTVLNPRSERVIFGGVMFVGDGVKKKFTLVTNAKPTTVVANFGAGIREVIVIDKDTVFEGSADLDEVQYNDVDGTLEFEKAPIAASEIYVHFERSLGTRVRVLSGKSGEYTVSSRGEFVFNSVDEGKIVFLEYTYVTNEIEGIARVFEPFTQMLKFRNQNTRLRASSANRFNLASANTVPKKVVDRDLTVFDYTGTKLYEKIVYKTIQVPDFGNNGFIRGQRYDRSIVEVILKVWQRTTVDVFQEVDIDSKRVTVEIEEGKNDAEFIVPGTYQVSISNPVTGELVLATESKKLGSDDWVWLKNGQTYMTLPSRVVDVSRVKISKLEDPENYLDFGNAFIDKGRRRYVLARQPHSIESIHVRVLHRTDVEIARGEENYIDIPDTDWEFVPPSNYVKFHRPLPMGVERIEITYSIADPNVPGKIITRVDDYSSEGTVFLQSGQITNGKYIVQQESVYRTSETEPGVIYFNGADNGKQARITFKHTKNIDYTEKAQELMAYLNEIKAAGVELFLTFFQGWTEKVDMKERVRDDILGFSREVREDIYYLVSDRPRYIGNIEEEPMKFPIAENLITVVMPAENYGYVQLPDYEFVLPNSIEINYVGSGERLYRVDELRAAQAYTVQLERGDEMVTFPEKIEYAHKVIVTDAARNTVDIGDYGLYANDEESRTLRYSGVNIKPDILGSVTRKLYKDESTDTVQVQLVETEVDFNLNRVHDIRLLRKQARSFKLGVLEKTPDHIVVTSPQLELDTFVTISDGINLWQTWVNADWNIPTVTISNANLAAGTTVLDYMAVGELIAAKGLMESEEIQVDATIDTGTLVVSFSNANLLLEEWEYEIQFFSRTGTYTFEFYKNEFSVDYSTGRVFFDAADVSKHVIIHYLHSRNRPYFILSSKPGFDHVDSVKLNEVTLVAGVDYRYQLVEIDDTQMPVVVIERQISKSSEIKVTYTGDDGEVHTDEYTSNLQIRKLFEHLDNVVVDYDLYDKQQTDYYNTTPNDYIILRKKDPPYRGMAPGIWHEIKGAFQPGSGITLGWNASMPLAIKHAAKTFYIDRDRILSQLNDDVLAKKVALYEEAVAKYEQLSNELATSPGNLRRISLAEVYNQSEIEVWELWPDAEDYVNPAYYGFLNIDEEVVYGFLLVEGVDYVYDRRTNEIVFLKNMMYESEFVIAYTYTDHTYLDTEGTKIERVRLNEGINNQLEVKIQFPGKPASDVELSFNPQTGKYEGYVEVLESYPFRIKATDIAGNVEEFNYTFKPTTVESDGDTYGYWVGPYGFVNRVYGYINGYLVDWTDKGNGKFEMTFDSALLGSGDERYNTLDLLVVDKAGNSAWVSKLFIESEGAYASIDFYYGFEFTIGMYGGIDPTNFYLLNRLEQWKVFHRIVDLLLQEVDGIKENLIKTYNEPGAVDLFVCGAVKPLYTGFAADFYPYYPYYGYPYLEGYSYPYGGMLYGYPYYDEGIFGKTAYYSLTNDYVTEEGLKRHPKEQDITYVDESLTIHEFKTRTAKNRYFSDSGEWLSREVILDTFSGTANTGKSLRLVVEFEPTMYGEPHQVKVDSDGNIEIAPDDNVGTIDIRYGYAIDRIKDGVLHLDCGTRCEIEEEIEAPQEESLTMIIDYEGGGQDTIQLI